MALIFTTKGEMDDSVLEKREGTVDNDNELTTWVEYWSAWNNAAMYCCRIDLLSGDI